MAEESDLEKNEPGSPRRLEKAREKGDVVRSRELTTFVLLATGLGGLSLTGVRVSEGIVRALEQGLQFERASAFDTAHMLAQAGTLALVSLQALLPFFGMMVAAALAAPLMLGGWVFSSESLLPNFSRMNPVAGIGRMFSTQSLAELTKTVAKSLMIGGVGLWVVSANTAPIMGLMSEPMRAALPHTMWLAAICCAVVIASLIVVVALDVPYQLWSYFRKLRMSREDLRQEHKENEGDPHLKAKIRRQQQAMARRRMMAEVPHADVIVTNPTHFAVALRYRDKDMRAPRVVAKGADLVALRIRALGSENGVPVLEAPALARALYRHTDLGSEIPAALYTAVAEVLAWAYRLRRWRREGGDAPGEPSQLSIPESLEVPEASA